MLVRALNDYVDYGPVVRLEKSRLYYVFAIERDNEAEYFYVYPVGVSKEHFGVGFGADPLRFKKELFEVISAAIPEDWEQQEVIMSHKKLTVTSFKEWFKDNFYIRAHDWSLEEDDYATTNRYYKIFEEKYAEIVKREGTVPKGHVFQDLESEYKSMDESKDQYWIFAAKHNDSFRAEHLFTLGDLYNLEYADVRDGVYQIWKWRSGDIYSITPDRQVALKDEHSAAYNGGAVLWLPVLKKVGNDKEFVDKAIRGLQA